VGLGEHFTVDGSLLEGLGQRERVFSQRKRKTSLRRMILEIHVGLSRVRSARTKRTSRKSDPEALLHAKARARRPSLSYSGNLLVENRNGLIGTCRVWEATGTAERHAALEMLQEIPGSGRVTVGGGQGLDTRISCASGRNIW